MRWLKEIFTSKTNRKIRNLEFDIENNVRKLNKLSDDLVLIKKLVKCKEVIEIEYPTYSVFCASNEIVREEEMAKLRDKARAEGYYFIHTPLGINSKNEIWAKDS